MLVELGRLSESRCAKNCFIGDSIGECTNISKPSKTAKKFPQMFHSFSDYLQASGLSVSQPHKRTRNSKKSHKRVDQLRARTISTTQAACTFLHLPEHRGSREFSPQETAILQQSRAVPNVEDGSNVVVGHRHRCRRRDGPHGHVTRCGSPRVSVRRRAIRKLHFKCLFRSK